MVQNRAKVVMDMPVSLSVENVPDKMAERLRERARRHHHSLQEELMTILEEALGSERLSLEEAEQRIRTLDLRTDDESTGWLRELRDVG